MKKIAENMSGGRAFASIAAAVLLSACAANTDDGETVVRNGMPDASTFSPARIEADVTFLSQDLLRGRDTGSEGHRIAANYVAAEFARLGLKTAGENGSYFQEVPMRTAVLNAEASSVSVTVDGETKQLTLGDDYLMYGNVLSAEGEVTAPVVYAGFGIHAPELGHDDLDGLDLKGKIVMVVSGAPNGFHTEIRAHHGSSTTKGKELVKRGALGYVSILSMADEKRRPFKAYKRYLGTKSFGWLPPASDANKPRFKASATLSHDVAKEMFKASGKSLNDVLSATEGGETGGFALSAEVSMKRESNHSETFDSPNVLAVLEGSDPVLKNEYVVISAHLDHIGVSKTAKGDDKINNGALDNAAGIAVMLDVARAYASADVKPRRSILFAAVTGEERGLLGAEYFAKYPTVNKASMIANVNLDMPILLYDFTDVVAFGAERSSLGPITAEAVSKIGVTLSPDPMPQEGIFTRSDHYRFVQQGIPSVFLVTGWGKDTAGKDGGKIFMDFLTKTYHSPHDEIDQAIDYEAGAKFAYVNWLITSAIANDNKRPTWNEGDFFGNTFAGK